MGGKNPKMISIKVLFPLPVVPIIPILSPLLISSDKSLITNSSSDLYLNDIFLSFKIFSNSMVLEEGTFFSLKSFHSELKGCSKIVVSALIEEKPMYICCILGNNF